MSLAGSEDRRVVFALLAAVLVLEAAIFSASFGKYFNLDSAFYVVHAPRSWQEFARCFTVSDESKQYRPLTLGLAGLLAPFFGAHPRPWHWVPLLFHLANTLLFFRLARRLLPNEAGAIVATAFWGLHSVVAWIAYDMTCISDLMAILFLFLALLSAARGVERESFGWKAASVALLVPALVSKEAAVTFPLALWITAALSHLGRSEEGRSTRNFLRALGRTLPLALCALVPAAIFAGILLIWLLEGTLYHQTQGAAYQINPLGSPGMKLRYFPWALNLPQGVNSAVGHALALAASWLVLAVSLVGAVRRRFRLDPLEWSGLVWFAGLCLPAFLLANRLAKWYLYAPLTGLALVIGSLCARAAGNARGSTPRLALSAACVAALAASGAIQNRAYLASSDATYVSNTLRKFVAQFTELGPGLPRPMTAFFLPALGDRTEKNFERELNMLATDPVSGGRFFSCFLDNPEATTLFPLRGDLLPYDYPTRADFRALQYLAGRFYDVTDYFRAGKGRFRIFVLPTLEGKIPPDFEGVRLDPGKTSYVSMRFGDLGASLPPDYASEPDLWILRYNHGVYYDVTSYYKGRRIKPGRRLIESVDHLEANVNRSEYYPDYQRFETPNGRPVFFTTPDRDIVSQIGGSTVIVPLGQVPQAATLRFDVSWMYETGDGAWAEVRVRAEGQEDVVFKSYMEPNPPGRGMAWKQVSTPLEHFAGKSSELVLRCYNERGRNTHSDWLNWRLIALEAPEAKGIEAKAGR